MVTSKKAFEKYGSPDVTFERQWMVVVDFKKNGLKKLIPALPDRVYCNKDLEHPLLDALLNLIQCNRQHELKTWDGCFNVRPKRGLSTMSLHSWGIAIDVNAATNGLGKEPTLSEGFVKCFTDAGFHWGGTWKRRDGMHFELSKI